MEQVRDILSKLHKILKCKIAIQIDDCLYTYPIEELVEVEASFISAYRETMIEKPGRKIIFYTDKNVEVSEEALSLAGLYLSNQFNTNDFAINIINGDYSYSDITSANQLIINANELYLILIDSLGLNGIEDELLEIIKNSVEAKHIVQYMGGLIAAVDEQNIYDACSSLQKNIMTELFVEPVIAIGGRLTKAEQFAELYHNCIDAMDLKESYGLNQKLLDYQSMILLRIISSTDKGLKEDIVGKIFSSKFIELLNNEIEQTIEEMFRNNLNLTDTSARLYIHRNTLLYRIDKIQKLTGYDLRKFEDSMIFKLAWLMYKEKIK